jgi:hypothetical protein
MNILADTAPAKRLQIFVFTDLRFTSRSIVTGVGKHIVQMTRDTQITPASALGLPALELLRNA